MGGEQGTEQEHHETYMAILRAMIDKMTILLGQKVSLAHARKAPVEIRADGTVTDFYGDGETAVRVLFERYANYVGEQVARSHIQRSLEELDDDVTDLLPDTLVSDE